MNKKNNSLIPVDTTQSGFKLLYEWLLKDRIERLNRLHNSIAQWHQLSEQEFEDYSNEVELKRRPEWEEYEIDPVRDKGIILLETERPMYANLAVSKKGRCQLCLL